MPAATITIMYRMLSRPRYMLLALVSTAVVFLAITWISAIPLAIQIFADEAISGGKALELIAQLFYSAFFDYTPLALTYAIAVSTLIGLNVGLLALYRRVYRAAPSAAATTSGFLGGLAAVIGFGCAACGSIFLISALGTVGGAGLLAFFPYGGEEIGYLGLILLVLSSILLSRAVNKPAVCPV